MHGNLSVLNSSGIFTPKMKGLHSAWVVCSQWILTTEKVLAQTIVPLYFTSFSEKDITEIYSLTREQAI